MPSRRLIFGTDEFAGDREIECFIAQVRASTTTTAAVDAASSSLAADTSTSMQNGVQPEGPITTIRPPVPAWLTVTLRAVPWHADDPECRYNPYHLRIIGRELSQHGNGVVDNGEDLLNSSENIGGSDPELDFDRTAIPRHNSTCYGDDDFDGGRDEAEWAPGFEGEGDGIDGKGERHASERAIEVEIATFCAKGVAHVNLHGETSFFTLEQWCLEKRRFDAMSRMRFCSR